MHRFFLTEKFQETMEISGKDGHHISHVLRMKLGDELQIVSLDQVSALMKITGFSEDRVTVQLLEKINQGHEPNVKLILAQGLPKGDKLELVVQKAVELGAAEICPLIMHNCVVKVDPAKASKKTARLQKIAEEAAKQSKRDIIPTIQEPVSFKNMLAQYADVDLKLVAYEVEDEQGLKGVLESNGQAKSILLLIGPEGGITKEEWLLAKEAGFYSVSLGTRILRTETAGIAGLAAILYATGNFGG